MVGPKDRQVNQKKYKPAFFEGRSKASRQKYGESSITGTETPRENPRFFQKKDLIHRLAIPSDCGNTGNPHSHLVQPGFSIATARVSRHIAHLPHTLL